MKRMLKVLTGLGLFAAMTIATPAWSVLIHKTGAVEAEEFDIVLSADGTGMVFGRECDDCEMRSFRITEDTRAFHNRQPVDIQEARGRRGKFTTIIYRLDAPRDAVRITW